ncbi:MAG TPA: ROK family protein [Ktedonobacteraceae bacterium]
MEESPAAHFVLGIDLGGTKMALATAQTDGTIIHRQVLPTLAEQGAEQAMSRVIEAARQLVEQTQAELGGVLAGVGLSTMGITLEDRVLMAPNVPGWDRLELPNLMRQSFSTSKIRIANDVKAAAAAELHWGELAGCDVGLYLNVGTGFAAALIVGERVIEGAHGAAGEIAYNLRHLHEETGFHHQRAPLEEFLGGGAIGERARLQFAGVTTAREIFQRAQTDAEARAFVEATLTELTFHVTNLTIALDPERIVIGGGLMASKELILPRLEAHIKRFVPFQPPVLAARFTQDAGLIGAIALALS